MSSAAPTLLVTGFEPFGGDGDNPSADIVSSLAPRDGLVTAVLPVAYADIDAAAVELLDRHRPGAALMIGLAATTAGIRLEQVALNLDDADGADNRGDVRRRHPIDAAGDAPVAYRSALPLDEIERLALDQRIPVEWSRDAGGFLCNHLFYVVRHRRPELPSGFVHVGRATPVATLVPLFDRVAELLMRP